MMGGNEMGALYPVGRIFWATALCLSLIPVPGAALPDRLPGTSAGSPEARPGEVEENEAAESEEAKFSVLTTPRRQRYV